MHNTTQNSSSNTPTHNTTLHTPYILGLDIGTNSLGWAVVNCEQKPENNKDTTKEQHQGIYAGYKPTSLKALNSRIFLEMVDAKTKIPNNQKRREARSARKRLKFYKKQRNSLIQLLIKNNLLPKEFLSAPEQTLNTIDRTFAERILQKEFSSDWSITDKAHATPYALRHYALEQELQPYELGRLFLHLRQRRGYFSNRGAKYVELTKYLNIEGLKDTEDDALDNTNEKNKEKTEESKERGKVLAAIAKLNEQLSEHTTLGQYIWHQAMQEKSLPKRINLHTYQQSKKVKGKDDTYIEESLSFFATREMYELEFSHLFSTQKKYHPTLLTDDNYANIEKLIYHQRPLQLQKSKVGRCSVYPRKKRCHQAALAFQEYRTRQVINNLRFDYKDNKSQAPTTAQKEHLYALCQRDSGLINQHYKIAFDKLARELGANKCNYESNNSDNDLKGLPVNRTAIVISRIIGQSSWERLSLKQQYKLVEDLLTIHAKKDLYLRLIRYWKFSSYQNEGENSTALKLCLCEALDSDYAKYSHKIINELNTHLRLGKNHYKAVESIDQVNTIVQKHQYTGEDKLLLPDEVPNVANPIVQKSLYEIRRVVNSIIKRYGMPEIIRIELAREMKSSKKHRSGIQKEQDLNHQRNRKIEEEIQNYYQQGNSNVKLLTTNSGGRRIDPQDRKKYKIWKDEQHECCPYCTKQIGINQLFNGQAEIEHIIPYTSFSQNFQNTIVSCQDCNRKKGNKTPHQTWGHDIDAWKRIETFAKKHFTGNSYAKQKRILDKTFKGKENIDEFTARQLNDTAYIATATKSMLQQYGVPIDVNNGSATSILRKHLGLQNILPQNDNINTYEEQEIARKDTQSGIEKLLLSDPQEIKKIRRDHRHHAIDALVVALTDRGMLKAMVDAHQIEQDAKQDGTAHQHALTKEHFIRQQRLKLPASWQHTEDLHKTVKNQLLNTVVSNMAKQKVSGALHEETLLGRSFYHQQLSTDLRGSNLKNIQKLCENPAFSNKGWIEDGALKDYLTSWVNKTLDTPSKERQKAQWQDKELPQFTYLMPAATTRRALTGDLLYKQFAKTTAWQTGTGTWIAERSIHHSLYHWLKKHELLGKDMTAKAIEQKLSENPPRIINKKGAESHPIKRIITATVWSNSYYPLNQGKAFAATGSNHHVVIFNNGLEGEQRQYKPHMVSMIEAAKRIQQKQPIINKQAPEHWEGEWHYQIHLCSQDMVRWENEDIFTQEKTAKNFHASFKDTPYFRVQKMSLSGAALDIFFRHHSVSGTDNDWGLLRISSIKNLQCRVVSIGNLGHFKENEI